MSESPSDRIVHIDNRLRALHSVVEDARTELDEVRRRQAELADMEAALLATIDARCRRLDDLLDERLRAGADVREGDRTGSGAARTPVQDVRRTPLPRCAGTRPGVVDMSAVDLRDSGDDRHG
ncbi:hypothetical protein [Geodermatophilus sp. SYSU D00684]